MILRITVVSMILFCFSCKNERRNFNKKDVKDSTIVKNKVVIMDKMTSDSLYELKKISKPWSDLDSFPDIKHHILFDDGKFIYSINDEIVLKREYRLSKNVEYGFGKYLLNINSDKFNSVDFFKDSIIIYQNAEDESVFTFTKK